MQKFSCFIKGVEMEKFLYCLALLKKQSVSSFWIPFKIILFVNSRTSVVRSRELGHVSGGSALRLKGKMSMDGQYGLLV